MILKIKKLDIIILKFNNKFFYKNFHIEINVITNNFMI
jgi:hypothetical protein